jgi:hypothetical protein
MTETESKRSGWLRGAVDFSNEFLDLIKNFAIVLFIVLFLFFGGLLRQKLDDAGFKITEVGPFKLEDVKKSNEQAKAAASNVDVITQKLGDLESKLTEAESRNPGISVEIGPLKSDVASLQVQAKSADATLKTSIIAQQDLIQKAAPQPSEALGWIYVGQVDESRTKWAGRGAVNLSIDAPSFQTGQMITLSADVYLHSSPATGGWHTQGDVTEVLPARATAEVVDSDYSHAKTGGWFVWLKVRSRGRTFQGEPHAQIPMQIDSAT